MTTQTTNTAAIFQNFHASDIKTLIQKQGRVTVSSGAQILLKEPSSTDPVLLKIIQDPKFTAKAVGTPTPEGLATYEVSGNGKTAKIKVAGQASTTGSGSSSY